MTHELPGGWAWTRLEDLVVAEPRAITDGPFGSNLRTAHYTESGPRVIRLQNIGDGVFRHEDARISEEHYKSLLRHSVREGDLVVASLGEKLPRACLVPGWVPPAIVKADCIRVRLHPDVDPAYVNFALQRPDLRHRTATEIRGVGRPRLGMAGVKNLAVPIAPLAEQKRIVVAIEEHFSRLDAVEHDITTARAKGATLPSVVLPGLFSTDWPTRRIGELARVGSGATPRRSEARYWSGGTIPWVTSGAVNERAISSASGLITQEALAETSVKLWPIGTALVAMYGEGKTRGKAALLQIESTCNQACAAIDYDRSLVTGDYLLTYLNSQYEASRRLASGGVQPNLSLGLIKNMEIPVPSIETQRSVALQAEDIVLGSEQLAATCTKARLHVTALRRSILAAAFSGQLVPQDPQDEPASVLLDRIAASRPTKLNRRASAR